MKKLLSLVLCLALALGCISIAESAGYSVGDSDNGFTVTDVRRFDLLGADLITLTHDKTGAIVMLILNEDTDRVFDITFRTVAENNNGTPHVFEHATLDGSQKYPSKELCFNLSYQTYNTYMNASTYPYMTTYPVSSLSEEQLLLYADYYLDSCFNPTLVSDESIFTQEAWRYSMTSEEDELTITGTVYNEMKGAYTIQSAAHFNAYSDALPGSTIGNVSGGKPSEIPNLTYEEVCAYHDKYYHPSNSLTVLYGKIENPSAFLALLDGVFSAYEARSFEGVFDDAGYTPITQSAVTQHCYGTEEGSDPSKGSYIYYSFICDGADYNVLDHLTTMIGDSSSAFSRIMKEKLPSAKTSCYVDNAGPALLVTFYASGVDAEDAEVFAAAVNEAVSEISANGFDSAAADAISASYSLSLLMVAETEQAGVNIIPDIAYYWVTTGSVYGYMDIIDNVGNLRTWANDGTLAAACSEWLNAEKAITSLSITSPVPGLKEAEDAAEAERLAEIKAGMSAEEIAAIVAATNGTSEANPDTAAMVASLTAVTVESLPEEARIYETIDVTGEDGVRRLYTPAEVDGVGTTMVRFSLSGLEKEQLLWAKLYLDIVGEIGTAEHSREEVSSMLTRYCYDASIRIVMPEDETPDGVTPWAHMSFTALDGEIAEGYNVYSEILLESDLSDIDAVAAIVSSDRVALKQNINSNGYSVEIYRMFSSADPTMAMYNYLNYLPYYDFLCDVEAMLAENPEAVIAALTEVRDYIANGASGAITGYAGSEVGFASHTAAADAFVASFGSEAREDHSYGFETIPASEALILETNTAFNVAFASWEELGIEAGYTAEYDAVCAFITDSYLMPMLRDERGAYGAYIYAGEQGIYLFTYRDPGVADSFAVFASVGEMLSAETEITQDIVDGYILSSYSYYAMPSGELTGAFSAMRNYLAGKAADQNVTYMRELKSLTAENLASYGEIIANVMQVGRFATVSSAATVNANAELYASVMNPFGAVDTSEIALPDVNEDYENYEVVRWSYDNMLMFTDENGCFNPEAPATLGDMSVALYIFIGGDTNVDDAIDTLAYYGIIDALPAETELTRDDMLWTLCNFYYAVGGDFDELEMVEYPDIADVSEGMDTYWNWAVAYGFVNTAEDGSLLPAATATRAELAQVLYVLNLAFGG